MPYSPLLVKPMRDELTTIGFEELKSAADVDGWMDSHSGTSLLIINSVCGCAAGMARPGVRLSLENDKVPNRLVTVFAGQDTEATAQARSKFPQIPPSSPSMAMVKDDEIVFFLPRHRIEGRTAEDVASELQEAFNEHC